MNTEGIQPWNISISVKLDFIDQRGECMTLEMSMYVCKRVIFSLIVMAFVYLTL